MSQSDHVEKAVKLSTGKHLFVQSVFVGTKTEDNGLYLSYQSYSVGMISTNDIANESGSELAGVVGATLLSENCQSNGWNTISISLTEITNTDL